MKHSYNCLCTSVRDRADHFVRHWIDNIHSSDLKKMLENPCSVMLTQIRISVNALSVVCMIFHASVNPWSVTYPCFVNRDEDLTESIRNSGIHTRKTNKILPPLSFCFIGYQQGNIIMDVEWVWTDIIFRIFLNTNIAFYLLSYQWREANA